MATIPLPALQVKPPENPLDIFSRVMQIKALQTQGQLQGVALQQAQLQQQDDQRWRSVFHAAADHPEWGPEDILQQGQMHGVGPNSYVEMSKALSAHQQALTTLGTDQNKLLSDINTKNNGYLQDILDASPNQKLEAQQLAKTRSRDMILNTPGLPQAAKLSFLKQLDQLPDDQYIGDDKIGLLMGSHNLHATMMDRTAKAAETQERLAGAARSTAEAGKITGESDPNSPLYSPTGPYLALGAAGGDKTAQTILTGEAAQAGAVASAKATAEGQVTPKVRFEGQVTPKVQFEQAQANYRAALSRQSENQNSIGRAGLAVLEKQGTDFSTFAGQMANLKTQLAAAQTGDEVAAAFAPVATALGSNAFYGTHRLAPSEVAALGPQLGSIGRQFNTWFDKAGTGKLPAESVQEFSNLVDRLSDAKYTAYQKSTDYAVKLHGLDPASTPVMDRDGSITTPATRTNAPASASAQRPAGATKKVPGSDGRMHWFDDKGNYLGIVNDNASAPAPASTARSSP